MLASTSVLRVGQLIVAALFLSGCTVGVGTRIEPASHFVYPNSNVTKLGPVSSSATGASLFVLPPMRSPELDRELYTRALAQQAGADTIVDYVVVSRVTMIPFLNIFVVTHELKGTAAKAEVGRQELR
jgi:hypothetical protein